MKGGVIQQTGSVMVSLFRTCVVAGIAALSASCATQYGSNFLTGGYSDKRIDETHYQVRFDGNGNTSSERVWSFWFYRCAELTKQKGSTYFTVQKADAKTSSAEPSSTSPLQKVDDRSDNAPRMMPATLIYIPATKITTWHTNAIIAMLNDPLPEGTAAFRAQSVLDDLDAYVKSGGKTPVVARDDVMKRAYVYKPRSPEGTAPKGSL